MMSPARPAINVAAKFWAWACLFEERATFSALQRQFSSPGFWGISMRGVKGSPVVRAVWGFGGVMRQGMAGFVIALALICSVGQPGDARAQTLFVDAVTSVRDPEELLFMAESAQYTGRCADFELVMGELRKHATVLQERKRQPGILPGTSDVGFVRVENAHQAFGKKLGDRYEKLKREGCPRRTASAPQLDANLFFSGGSAALSVPLIGGGTFFSGTELPITQSDAYLTGYYGQVFATVPLSPAAQNSLWGDYFFVDAAGGSFTGTSNGAIGVGVANVRQTYIYPNPNGGAVGTPPGATGQSVTIDSDGNLIDLTMGVKGAAPLTPTVAPGISPVFEQASLHSKVGFRYRYLGLSHTIAQNDLTNANVNSRIDIDQHSHFFGPLLGIGVIAGPMGNGPGFTGGFHAFVSPGVAFTQADAAQHSRCGVCGVNDQNVFLQRDFSEAGLAVLFGLSTHLGYKVNASTQIFVNAKIEHMAGAPMFDEVPTTPSQQPIGLGSGSVTNASVSGGVSINLHSDIRLKRDIAPVGRLANGLKLYRYRYAWGASEYVGVMAQEVALLRPDAVSRDADGLLRVDYARLGLRMVRWQDWQAGMSVRMSALAR